MDLHMKNLQIWFDVWGYMEGCTYEAMATAIECSKVVVVFLSKKYQDSLNCQLEFKYAVARGKPFVFVSVEDNLVLEPWLKVHYDESPKFDIKSVQDENILHNGVSRIHALAQAVRDIGFAQPDPQDEYYELSDEANGLRETLEDALDEIDRHSGTSRFKKCTRCGKEFDENSLLGCYKHSAYYLGGVLIAGRWVCCSQLEADSVGCVETNHIDTVRQWVTDPHYGTDTWQPP
jgi:hypothetical protein